MKIQIMKTYRESFHNVFSHKLDWVQAMFAPFLLLLLGFLFLVFTILPERETVRLTGDLKLEGLFLLGVVVFFSTVAVSLVSLTINGCRYALLQIPEGWLNLNLKRRFLKMAVYLICYGLLVGLYNTASAISILGIGSLLKSEVVVMFVVAFLSILSLVVALYIMFRIALYPLAISIDQPRAIETSWGMMKGNILRYLGLIFLITLTLFFMGGLGALALLLLSPLLEVVVLFIAGVFGFFMLWLTLSIKFKAMGLVYQQLAVDQQDKVKEGSKKEEGKAL